jgi:hypothetical protein
MTIMPRNVCPALPILRAACAEAEALIDGD